MSGEQAHHTLEAGEQAAGRPPLLWRLRARLTGRPDTEHEQILVRVAIGVVIVSGLVIAAVGDPPPPQVLPLLAIATCYLVGGVLLLAHLLADPAPRPAMTHRI